MPEPAVPPWRVSPRLFVAMLVPFGFRRLAGRGTETPDTLTAVRSVFLSFVIAVFVTMPVVATLLPGGGDLPTDAVGAAVVLAGVVAQIVGAKVERPLDCATDATLLASYRTRFFLRLAFAETAALAGFLGVMLTGEEWVYATGLVVALAGFVRLAPTAANLRADEAALRASGCRHSLVTLLTGEA